MSATSPGPADWNASEYSRVSSPQRSWASEVISRLELSGYETVLDAGCGSGEVTRLLLDELPEGKVVAVDGSLSMVELAREHLPADRAEVLHRDLNRLEMDGYVDHAFSNAVFHWLADHEALFSCLHAAIRPGGRLSAQCGGAGNVAEVEQALEIVCGEEPFAGPLGGFVSPWNFAGPDETEARLVAAGFEEADCWLVDRIARPEEPQSFLEASFLAPFRELLEAPDFSAFGDRLMQVMGQPETFQYVRLNIVAKRD